MISVVRPVALSVIAGVLACVTWFALDAVRLASWDAKAQRNIILASAALQGETLGAADLAAALARTLPEYQITVASAAPTRTARFSGQVTIPGNAGPQSLRITPSAEDPRDILFFAPEWGAVLVGLAVLLAGSGLAQQQTLRSSKAHLQSVADDLTSLNSTLIDEIEVRRTAETTAHHAQRATEQFLATMSHEVRTPLNAIMGMFELIQTADLPDRVLRQAKAGHNAAQRLFRELSNVLDASRLASDSFSVTPLSTPLAPLVDQWNTALIGLIARTNKPIKTSVHLAKDLPEVVLIDPDRVTQVVSNLMDNAVKFTEAGRISIDVSREGETLSIAIADTGIGIPAEHRDQVFKRFRQLDNGVGRLYQGAGLGLSISHDIANLMNASLDLKATKGRNKGSTFTLKLRNSVLCSPQTLPVHDQFDPILQASSGGR